MIYFNKTKWLLLIFKVLLVRAFSTEYHIHPFIIELNPLFQSVQVEIVSYVFIIYLWKKFYTKNHTSTKNSWPSRSQNHEIQPPEADPSLSSSFAPPGTIPLIFWFCLLVFEYIVKSCMVQSMFILLRLLPLFRIYKIISFLYFL